ncbi:MAG: TolC family protein, partial [Magnetococcales bacterium]|nr:TolC family protein [Magnetococcales bacterium]
MNQRVGWWIPGLMMAGLSTLGAPIGVAAPLAPVQEAPPAEKTSPGQEGMILAREATLEKSLSETKTIPLPAATKGITLDECLALAYQQNLGLAIKREAVLGKRASESAKFRKMLPSVNLESSRYDYIQNTESGGSLAESYESSITITQPLYRGKALWSSWKSAGISKEQASLDAERQAETLTRDVKKIWYQLLEADQLLTETTSSLERLQQHEKNAEAFYQEGRYWRNEVLQARVEVAQGEQKVIESKNKVALAKSRLNRLLRQPLETPLNPQGDLSWQDLSWSLESAYDHAQGERPDLKKAHLAIESGEWGEESARAGMLPTVDLSASWSWEADDIHYRDTDTEGHISLNLDWDIWEWGRTRQEVAAARSTTRQKRLSHQEMVDKVRLEVREAFLNAQEASLRVGVLKKALEQAEENYRVNQIRYRERLGTATDVLDAQELLTKTRKDHISALSSYLQALATLDFAVGREFS